MRADSVSQAPHWCNWLQTVSVTSFASSRFAAWIRWWRASSRSWMAASLSWGQTATRHRQYCAAAVCHPGTGSGPRAARQCRCSSLAVHRCTNNTTGSPGPWSFPLSPVRVSRVDTASSSSTVARSSAVNRGGFGSRSSSQVRADHGQDLLRDPARVDLAGVRVRCEARRLQGRGDPGVGAGPVRHELRGRVGSPDSEQGGADLDRRQVGARSLP